MPHEPTDNGLSPSAMIVSNALSSHIWDLTELSPEEMREVATMAARDLVSLICDQPNDTGATRQSLTQISMLCQSSILQLERHLVK